VTLAHQVSRSRLGFALATLRSLRAGYLLATSRLVVVDDYFFPMYVIRPRPSTTFVQVWHACGALKRFGYSLEDRSFGRRARRNGELRMHSNYDLCLVSSASVAPFYADAFRLPLTRFTARLGIPRTDFFHDAGRLGRAADDVRRRYAIPAGRRVILYAPTFRGERITQARSPESLDLDELQRALGDDHVLLWRGHPFVGRATHPPRLAGFVIDVSDHPDVNELMAASDILVTDYSSVIFEFALLGRPMAFFAPDHAEYEAERGFYVDYPNFVPGPLFTTTPELVAHLRGGVPDVERVQAFARASFDVVDGRATARFVEQVVLPALGGDGVGPAGSIG
jgi:CDP-ribitol ribitolphosphotransferase